MDRTLLATQLAFPYLFGWEEYLLPECCNYYIFCGNSFLVFQWVLANIRIWSVSKPWFFFWTFSWVSCLNIWLKWRNKIDRRLTDGVFLLTIFFLWSTQNEITVSFLDQGINKVFSCLVSSLRGLFTQEQFQGCSLDNIKVFIVLVQFFYLSKLVLIINARNRLKYIYSYFQSP